MNSRRSFGFFFRGTFGALDGFLDLVAELGWLRLGLAKSSFTTGFLFPFVVGTDLDGRSTIGEVRESTAGGNA
jgi:hypothetical protein